MTRNRQLSEEEMQNIIQAARKEVKAAKVRMKEAESANDLENYQRNEIIYRMEIATIRDMVQKLHPHVPLTWYNEYGEQIIPVTTDDDFNSDWALDSAMDDRQ